MIGLMLLGSFVGAVVGGVLARQADEEPCRGCGRYFTCDVGPRKMSGRCVTRGVRWTRD